MYRFLTNYRKSVNGIILTYVVATITNLLSNFYDSIGQFFASCMDFGNFSVLLMWILIILFFLTNLVAWPLSKWSYQRSKAAFKLTRIMEANTSDCFEDKVLNGGYSWGDNKCLLAAANMFAGFDPKDVLISDYKAIKYQIPKEHEDEYRHYLASAEAKNILEKHNNMTRCMLSGYYSNLNKQGKQIYIKLQQTDYLTASFFWNRYKRMTNGEKKKIINDLFEKRVLYPNSFCLHLAILTKDDDVVVTAIGGDKNNDYPYSWAVTIGEQLEVADFDEGVEIRRDFVSNWVYRALYEEFGLYQDQVETIIAENGIRVLSLDSEGNINNISLMVVVHMVCTFEEFLEEVSIHPEIDKEFSRISKICINDIPLALSQYNQKKALMHPSSYLRLFMCYLHRRGIGAFVKEFDNASKKSGSKKLFYDVC